MHPQLMLLLEIQDLHLQAASLLDESGLDKVESKHFNINPIEAAAALEEKIQELCSFDPPAVLKQNDAFVLDLPVLNEDDLEALLRTGDEVAETVHNQVVLPYHRERIRRSKDLGLKAVLPGDVLAREFALQSLIEEGDLPPPPVAPRRGKAPHRGTAHRRT